MDEAIDVSLEELGRAMEDRMWWMSLIQRRQESEPTQWHVTITIQFCSPVLVIPVLFIPVCVTLVHSPVPSGF